MLTMHCSLMILLQFTIIRFLEVIFIYCIHIWVILCNAVLMCIFSQFMLPLKSAVLGVFTPGKLAKAIKSIPFLLFFRDLVVTHLPALHCIWSLKKPGVVSVVRKIKA